MYKATWDESDVAVKKLKNTQSQRELILEAETAIDLRHPNCVQFFGVRIVY